MSDKTEIAAEVIGVSVSNKATLAGAATGAFGWVTQINWIGVIGVAIALGGLLVNAYFQARRDRREAIESAARIKSLSAGGRP